MDKLHPQFGMYIVTLYPSLCKYQFVSDNHSIALLIKWLGIWGLTSLSTISQLNRGGMFYWWR